MWLGENGSARDAKRFTSSRTSSAGYHRFDHRGHRPDCDPGLLRRAAISGTAIIGAWLAGSAWAADPQTYKVRLEGAVSNEIENTPSANSDLVSLRSSAPVSPVGLILRARSDTVRFKTVLKSYGYYQSAITVTIDGDALTGADVADKLAALPKGTNASMASFRGASTSSGKLPSMAMCPLRCAVGSPCIPDSRRLPPMSSRPERAC